MKTILKTNKIKISILLFVSCIHAGCLEPFYPDVSGHKTLTVVEGLLTDKVEESYVKLSRSYPLDSVNATPVTASVYILENENTRIDLIQETNDPGTYRLPPNYQATIGHEYVLRIIVNEGESYTSTPVTLLQTPPIDSIYYEVNTHIISVNENEKYLQLYVDSHDPKNTTRYYRWRWSETYEIRTPAPSYYIIDREKIRERTEDERIDRCWIHYENPFVDISNTIHLSSDVISHHKLTAFTESSIKPVYLYSIYVEQYALSKQGYEFYDLLRDMSERLGSLFDPQPTQVIGNITNDQNPKAPVLGNFDASTISSKRYFLKGYKLPGLRFWNQPFKNCDEVIAETPSDIMHCYSIGYVLLYPSNLPLDSPTEWVPFRMGNRRCYDCRTLGVNVKPDYWPN